MSSSNRLPDPAKRKFFICKSCGWNCEYMVKLSEKPYQCRKCGKKWNE